MRKTQKPSPISGEVKSRPALTPEARENQLISLAVDLVEKRLREGTASSQETTHFLKLASSKASLEKELLKAQRDLAEAKVQSIKAADDTRRLFKEAMDAFTMYRGGNDDGNH